MLLCRQKDSLLKISVVNSVVHCTEEDSQLSKHTRQHNEPLVSNQWSSRQQTILQIPGERRPLLYQNKHGRRPAVLHCLYAATFVLRRPREKKKKKKKKCKISSFSCGVQSHSTNLCASRVFVTEKKHRSSSSCLQLAQRNFLLQCNRKTNVQSQKKPTSLL